MCRHLAYLGVPRSLASLLHEPAHSLEHQSWGPTRQREGAMNADGWGVGWWDRAQRPEPARYRTASPMWTDRSFRSVSEVVRSGAIVAAVRSATPGSPIVTTGNAPFAGDRWLFSHNGYVEGFRYGIGEQLRRSVTERRAADIEGTADSEVLFAMALDRLDEGASPAEALDDVTAAVLDLTDGRLNLLLCDGHELVATAWGNSLFTLRGTGLAEDGFLVASEPLDEDPGWTAVPDGTAVLASADRLDAVPLSASGGTS
jgi:glutamine amidotransferase